MWKKKKINHLSCALSGVCDLAIRGHYNADIHNTQSFTSTSAVIFAIFISEEKYMPMTIAVCRCVAGLFLLKYFRCLKQPNIGASFVSLSVLALCFTSQLLSAMWFGSINNV